MYYLYLHYLSCAEQAGSLSEKGWKAQRQVYEEMTYLLISLSALIIKKHSKPKKKPRRNSIFSHAQMFRVFFSELRFSET